MKRLTTENAEFAEKEKARKKAKKEKADPSLRSG
jgi:hypothetical protein